MIREKQRIDDDGEGEVEVAARMNVIVNVITTTTTQEGIARERYVLWRKASHRYQRS